MWAKKLETTKTGTSELHMLPVMLPVVLKTQAIYN